MKWCCWAEMARDVTSLLALFVKFGLGLSHLQQLHSTIGNAQKILGDKKRRSLGGICFHFQDAPCTQNHLMKMCKQRWPCSLHFVARNWNLRKFEILQLLEIRMFHSKWQWKWQWKNSGRPNPVETMRRTGGTEAKFLFLAHWKITTSRFHCNETISKMSPCHPKY